MGEREKGRGIKYHLAFQIFILPSCGKGNAKLHWATVRSTGGSSYHLPIMVKPAGHSKSLGREPITTKTQLRTRAQNEGF